MEITVGLALIAGVVSFISPCVLPLVPAYIGYMGGRISSGAASGRAQGRAAIQQRLNIFLHGVFFVAGFSLIFVAIGLLSTAFVQQISGGNIRILTDLIGRLGGVLIIFFGLHFMGVLPALFQTLRARRELFESPAAVVVIGAAFTALLLWGFNGDIAFWDSFVWASTPVISIISLALAAVLWGWMAARGAFTEPAAFAFRSLDALERALYSDTRRALSASGQRGYLDSAAMGVVFSAGWTPCIGPVYGAVLTMAANGGEVGRAGILLAGYSLGLGIPFLLTALLLDGVQRWLKRLRRHMRVIQVVSGAFLIVIGIAVASGQLQRLSQQFAGDFAEFSVGVETRVLELVTGTEMPESASAVSSAESPASSERIGLEIGDLAPDFASVTPEGQPIALSDFRGSVVLLNFWATWCGPCRIEMPGFQRQYMAYGDQGLVILAVNNAEPVDLVTAFRDQLRLTFPIVMDESGEIQRQYGILNYPTSLAIDRDGRIVSRHFGVVPPSQIAQMLAELGFAL